MLSWKGVQLLVPESIFQMLLELWKAWGHLSVARTTKAFPSASLQLQIAISSTILQIQAVNSPGNSQPGWKLLSLNPRTAVTSNRFVKSWQSPVLLEVVPVNAVCQEYRVALRNISIPQNLQLSRRSSCRRTGECCAPRILCRSEEHLCPTKPSDPPPNVPAGGQEGVLVTREECQCRCNQ